MTEWISSFFVDIRRNFGVVDGFDILLVSVIFYSLLVWFRETASRRVLIGVLVLAAVYLVARLFDMYLTSLMFHAGLAVLVILLIVVFQEDLRRMLEGVANWRLLRQFRTGESQLMYVDAIVESVFAMSAERTGALIVLKGGEPIDRHLDGGITLRGEISKPLLYSIFDPSSPGHDGAVVIQDGRIESFAVHLPISKNQAEIAGRGTRHSAALGLSESCDALVIAVSEERGTVTVAESGRLTAVRSAAALKGRIERFLTDKHPQEKTAAPWRQLVARDWPLKAAALVFAIAAWFGFAYNPDTIQRTFVVPIQYRNLPTTLVLDNSAPHEARLTLSGSERDFRFLEPGTLRVSIDLASAQPGTHEFDIEDESIRLPADLDLYGVDPRVVRLVLSATGSAAPADRTKTSNHR